jgi:adenylate kinase
MGLYLLLMGVQGAGKGVQAARIRDAYTLPHVSTGDLFRAMRTRDDALARKIQEIMKAGQLVSDEDTNAVLADRLQQPDAANGVIFDGYPRNIAQAEWLANYLESRGERLAAVLMLELDLYTAFKRAFGRVTGADGSSYNIYFNSDGLDYAFVDHETREYPPKLVAKAAATGESLQRRPDDASADAVLKRIDTYVESTRPLADYYREKGLLVTVNADQSIDQVWSDIQAAIERARVR